MKKFLSFLMMAVFSVSLFAATYTVAGDNTTVFGEAWTPAETANDMTLVDGLYTFAKTGVTLPAGSIAFKVCQDHAWTNCWPEQNYSLSIPASGKYDITITFNESTKDVNAKADKKEDVVVLPSIAMHGNFLGSWADTENFTVSSDQKTATLKLAISASESAYEFGMRIGGSGNWTANGASFTRTNPSAVVSTGSGNLTLTADATGEYTFTWTFASNTLVVTFPEKGGDTPEPPAAAKFYITGDSALVVDAGLEATKAWHADAIKSMETSYKLNLKANVDYKLKVTVDGTWEDGKVKGFSDLTTTADGLTGDNDGNICFKLNTAGEVNVHYDGEFFFLNGDFYEAPAPEQTYYLKNNWEGAQDWTWKEMTKSEDGTYMLVNVVFGGTGVNISTDPNEETPKFIEMKDIETFDAGFNPAQLGALDTVVFFFDPEEVSSFTGANGLTAQIIGKYVEPVTPPTPALYDTLYFVNTLGWATPYGYYWPIEVSNWPGQELTKTEDKVGNYDVYMFVAPVEKISNCVFNDGASENTKQTVDLAPINNDKYFVPSNEQDNVGAYKGTWYATLDAITGEQLAAGFYLIGQKGWTVADLSEDLKFAETTTANVYSLTVTLAKDQEIKAVYVNDKGEIANWMPKDGGNFVVSDKYAGEKTVLLNVTGKGGEGWFEGYLYVEPNPDQPTLAAKFFITGDSAFVVDAGLDKAKTWNSDAIASQKDTFELSLKANQAYEMQVIVGEAWKGFTDLTVKPDGVKAGGEYGNNICFSLAEAGTVKVIYFVENEQLTFKVEGNFYVKPVEKKDLFLVPNQWAEADAKIAAWTWGTELSGEWTSFFAPKAEGNDTLVAKVNAAAEKVIFVRFSPEETEPRWEGPNQWNQTPDDIIQWEKGVIFTITGCDGYNCTGTWDVYAPQPPVSAKFFITGDSAFIVDAGLDKAKAWNSDAIASQKDTFELSLKANQAYEMQVIVGEAWKGFTDLTVKPDGVKAGGEYGNNICFSLAEAGTVKVIYFVENEQLTFKVEGKFYVEPVTPPTPTIADGFYLVGTFNSWTPAADYQFAANPDKAGEYQLTVTLAKDEEFKVAYAEDGVNKDWFPSTGDNFVVTDKYVGEKTIYFNPDYQQDWAAFGGYFYLAENEDQPAAEWAEIVWTEAVAAADFGESRTFTLEGSEFKAEAANGANKMAIDGNDCRFGTAEAYKMYNYRFKTGGGSSSKAYITYNIPADGKLRIAVRTASNSATNRNLVLTQGESELYNEIVQESLAIKVTEGEGDKAKEVSVYPYVEVAVKKGSVTATYPNGALNFYAFAFAADGGDTPEPPAAAKFYITGDSALVVDAGLEATKAWNADAIKSMETSYKLNLKANVDYKLKVTVDGTWEDGKVKGFGDLTTTANGLTGDNDGNICFKLNTAGEVNVHYDGEFFFLNGDFYVAPAPEQTYYLKNNWEGAQDWTWKAMTKEDGYYSLANVVFGGTGVNISTDPENDGDPKFIEAKDIETFDAAFESATLGALDTVVFFFDPEEVNSLTGANGLTAQIIGKYVEPVTPPTPSVIYSVAGSKALLGAEWNEKEGNEMTLDAADGLYKLLCADVTLAAGTKYEYKVVTDHNWNNPNYPDANKELYVDKDGKYDVTITFNAETKEVAYVAEFKGGAVVEKHYLIVGDADVANGQNWNNDADENLMTSADEGVTYTLVVKNAELLQNKLYGYKVVEKGSWTEYYPNTGDNAYFSVEESAIYTITYTYTVATSQCAVVTTKSGEMPEPALANGLYLVGTFNGVDAWTINDLSAEKMFKATSEEGQYSIDVTLLAGDKFKAVYVEADAIQIWYPDGQDNDYVVDADHAGQKTIYFRPVFWADWNGHFYVAPNEGPAPEPTYYLKNNWEGAQDWTWKAMTKLDDGSYMLANVVFGGIGVNISTDPENDGDPKFIEAKDIETFDAAFESATLGALDTVVFFFDPEAVNQYTGANGLTAQIIGKYVEPVIPPTPDPTVVVIGDMNNWDENDPIAFTLSQDKKTASLVVPKIPVGDYNFKLKINGEWRSNGWWFNRNVTSAAGINSNAEADMRLQADVEGQYTFTWTFANDSLDIIFPAKPEQPTLADGFYFVGTANNWTPAEGYMFSKNPDNEGEYMFTTTLAENDEFKAVKVENGTYNDDSWYPAAGGNYVVDAAHAGEKTIYFRPEGNTEWGGNFYIAPNGDQPIEPGELVDITLVPGVWNIADAKFAAVTLNKVPEGTFDMTSVLAQATFSEWFVASSTIEGAYVGKIPADTKIIAFGRFAPETEIPSLDAVMSANFWNHSDMLEIDASMKYTIDGWPAEGKDYCPGHWGDLPTIADGFYFVGTANEWTPAEGYMFSKNPDNEAEYMFTTTLAAGDEFKVVYVENGTYSNDSWYPGGEGDNYIVDAAHAGEKTIYFRPDYKGGEDWYYGCIFVPANSGEGFEEIIATDKAAKIIRNGQFFIIKGDKMYNVTGAKIR